ncbi:hypothetical protein SDC9_198542 [bioreactor metagenome]|uniref:Uncharacterized protein n=1 Tax=bioreactor metagenome TaxID=1076179 RepID=A0A645IJ78_9ZZZZ
MTAACTSLTPAAQAVDLGGSEFTVQPPHAQAEGILRPHIQGVIGQQFEPTLRQVTDVANHAVLGP